MIHLFRALDKSMALDVGSGAVHALDAIAFDALSLMENKALDDAALVAALAQKHGEAAAAETVAELRELIVRTGDHFGHALKKSVELGARRLHLFGHVGKWAKVAAGLFNTHCDYGDARLETLAACAGACGARYRQPALRFQRNRR